MAVIFGTADSRNKECHHLIADQLVHDCVMLDERFGRRVVEPVERRGKRPRAKPLAQLRRTPDVREKHSDIELRATCG